MNIHFRLSSLSLFYIVTEPEPSQNQYFSWGALFSAVSATCYMEHPKVIESILFPGF